VNNYPRSLLIQQYKLNSNKFTKYGLNTITEAKTSNDLCQEILSNIKNTKSMNMKKLVSLISKHGLSFKQYCLDNMDDKIKEYNSSIFNNIELDNYYHGFYTSFVGDFFEAFAEFFLKTFDNDTRFGVRNYEPYLNSDDYGVDGSGLCYDDTNGINPCVVQVKFRSNLMEEIEYSMLARTCTQGVMKFGIDPRNVKNCIIIFSSGKGVNHITKDVLGNSLFEINNVKINHEINNIDFWEHFSNIII
jgi:hypothetical protein